MDDLELREDKFVQALFNDIIKEQGDDLHSMKNLTHLFVTLKRDSILSSFIKEDSIQSYLSGCA